MDLSYTPEYEIFRREVQAFLEESWPLEGKEADLPAGEQQQRFRARAIDAGYLYRNIPSRYGGAEQEPDVHKAQIIREEFRRARAPGELGGLGTQMLVPTLLERGAEWQKEKWVRPTIEGKYVWCQGYSEPGAGSDLASLQSRAELVGDEWVINGQKIWTTGARQANMMFGLFRTEPDAPKHGGISYLLLDPRQPGVEIRPLKQITGTADFNEVFFTDARTPASWIVGERGEGWDVSRSLLRHERNMVGNAQGSQATFRSLLRLCRESDRLHDPEIREKLAEIYGYVQTQLYSGYYQQTKGAKGEEPGLVGLMNKIGTTNINAKVAALALSILQSDSLYDPFRNTKGDTSGRERWMNQFLGSLGMVSAGGTANIQRNIIAERGLGLPRS